MLFEFCVLDGKMIPAQQDVASISWEDMDVYPAISLSSQPSSYSGHRRELFPNVFYFLSITGGENASYVRARYHNNYSTLRSGALR